MIFFTADQHFWHTNIIKYCFRPFNNINDMNNTLIESWNKVVKPNDTVFQIGDLILSNDKKQVRDTLSALHGRIILVTGDHDRSSLELYPERFQSIHSFYKFSLSDSRTNISLMHWCMRVWPTSHYNSWHLYGHSHGQLPSVGKSHDIGVDCNNFTPISLDEIEEKMKLKEDNFNLVKNKKKEENILQQIEIEFAW